MRPPRSSRLAALGRGLSFALALAFTGHGAQAVPILGVSQARSLAASASSAIAGSTDSDSDTASAPDFGLFDESIAPDALVQLAASGQTASATGTASQVSSLGSNSVTSSGSARAQLGLTPGTNGSAEASASSVFEFVFDIAATSDFALTGTLDTQALLAGGADLPTIVNDLLFENLTTATTLFQALSDDEAFAVSGLLLPGTYRLTASASVNGTQTSTFTSGRSVDAKSTYAFTLDVVTVAVPEPGSLGLALSALAMMAGGHKRAAPSGRRGRAPSKAA